MRETPPADRIRQPRCRPRSRPSCSLPRSATVKRQFLINCPCLSLFARSSIRRSTCGNVHYLHPLLYLDIVEQIIYFVGQFINRGYRRRGKPREDKDQTGINDTLPYLHDTLSACEPSRQLDSHQMLAIVGADLVLEARTVGQEQRVPVVGGVV